MPKDSKTRAYLRALNLTWNIWLPMGYPILIYYIQGGRIVDHYFLKDSLIINSVLKDECKYSINKSVNAPPSQDIHIPINEMVDSKKRIRRLNIQIEKSYNCPGKDCGKSYGTRDALNFHVRRKHPIQCEQRKKERSIKLYKSVPNDDKSVSVTFFSAENI